MEADSSISWAWCRKSFAEEDREWQTDAACASQIAGKVLSDPKVDAQLEEGISAA